jgi:hypothetical protein
MSVIGMPSATSKIIRPRRTHPAAIVVERCHTKSVRRWAGVRRIVREVLRPRAISRPPRQETMRPKDAYQRGQTLSQTSKDTTTVFEKGNISWCTNIPKFTSERKTCENTNSHPRRIAGIELHGMGFEAAALGTPIQRSPRASLRIIEQVRQK